MGITTTFRCAGETHPGLRRTNNEDRFHLDVERGIFLVIDGIGGQAAGERAAEIALDSIRARLKRQTGSLGDRIREAITVANNEIFRLAQTRDNWKGMACVLTVAVVEDGQVTVGHVGDTRLYELRGGQIRKITHDHSPVGDREDSGRLNELEAMQHPRRNEVYRDVGSEEHHPDDDNFVELVQLPFESDSALLLCSDGLSDLLTSAQILRIAQEYAGDPWAVVQQLIAAANDAGGKDNVTVLFVEGESFAPAGSRAKRETKKGRLGERQETQQRFAARFPGFGGRWAFFLYGVLLGVVLWNALQPRLWQGPDSPEIGSALGHSAKTLAVGPGTQFDFSNISEALQQAQAGDTIEVSPGQYGESLILKEGVNLISQGYREAVILSAGQASDAGVAVVAENLKSGRFAGFKIQGDGKTALAIGLRLTGSSLEIEDLEISGTRVAAVEVKGSAATLRANYIHDNLGSAVLVSALATPHLAHNVIVNNGKQTGDPKAGLEVLEGARPTLVGNVIADNGVYGIRGWNADSETLRRNFFRVGGIERARAPQGAEDGSAETGTPSRTSGQTRRDTR
jgi:serine/threonine protein phosphatase PrpC